jgi:N-acetylneuraminic acid mutarotase
VALGNKIYTFGGCFMFNKKRQVRECTNQLLEFDTSERRMTQCKTTGFSAGARKNHCATTYKKSMVIYGGISESNIFFNEMIVCQLDQMEWVKI